MIFLYLRFSDDDFLFYVEKIVKIVNLQIFAVFHTGQMQRCTVMFCACCSKTNSFFRYTFANTVCSIENNQIWTNIQSLCFINNSGSSDQHSDLYKFYCQYLVHYIFTNNFLCCTLLFAQWYLSWDNYLLWYYSGRCQAFSNNHN